MYKQPKAIYTHCAGHSFNLAILSSCTLPPIRNCIDQVKSITLWIKNSVVKLQGEKQDIVTGIALVQDCIKELKYLRSDIQNYSERIFQHSCRLVARLMCLLQYHVFVKDSNIAWISRVILQKSITIPLYLFLFRSADQRS